RAGPTAIELLQKLLAFASGADVERQAHRNRHRRTRGILLRTRRAETLVYVVLELLLGGIEAADIQQLAIEIVRLAPTLDVLSIDQAIKPAKWVADVERQIRALREANAQRVDRDVQVGRLNTPWRRTGVA